MLRIILIDNASLVTPPKEASLQKLVKGFHILVIEGFEEASNQSKIFSNSNEQGGDKQIVLNYSPD